jgi:ribosomal protein L35AE/L33A
MMERKPNKGGLPDRYGDRQRMNGVLKARVGGRKNRTHRKAIAHFPEVSNSKQAHTHLVGKKVRVRHSNREFTGRVERAHGQNGKVIVGFQKPISQQAIESRSVVTVV